MSSLASLPAPQIVKIEENPIADVSSPIITQSSSSNSTDMLFCLEEVEDSMSGDEVPMNSTQTSPEQLPPGAGQRSVVVHESPAARQFCNCAGNVIFSPQGPWLTSSGSSPQITTVLGNFSPPSLALQATPKLHHLSPPPTYSPCIPGPMTNSPHAQLLGIYSDEFCYGD